LSEEGKRVITEAAVPLTSIPWPHALAARKALNVYEMFDGDEPSTKAKQTENP